MDVSTSLRIAVAAVLVSSSAFAQESRLEEIVVTSTALRESPLEIAQPTTRRRGLRRKAQADLDQHR